MYGGCPCKLWTIVITPDCVQVTLIYLKDVFIYIWETSCINMGKISSRITPHFHVVLKTALCAHFYAFK